MPGEKNRSRGREHAKADQGEIAVPPELLRAEHFVARQEDPRGDIPHRREIDAFALGCACVGIAGIKNEAIGEDLAELIAE